MRRYFWLLFGSLLLGLTVSFVSSHADDPPKDKAAADQKATEDKSKADAKRGIQGQGFSINGEKVAAADRVLTLADVIAGRFIALQKGRRNFALIRID